MLTYNVEFVYMSHKNIFMKSTVSLWVSGFC